LLIKAEFSPIINSLFNNVLFNTSRFPRFQQTLHPFHSNQGTGVCFLLKKVWISFSKELTNSFNRLRNTGKEFFKFFIY